MTPTGAGGRVHPTHDDPVIAALSDAVGGPMGVRSRGSRWWTPVRVVLALTAVCLAVGLLQKAPCAEEAWQNGAGRYAYLCASPVADSYLESGLVERAGPSVDDVPGRFEAFTDPPGAMTWAWASGWVTQALHGFPDLEGRYRLPVGVLGLDPDVRDEITDFAAVNAVGLAALALLAAWLLTRVRRSRPWDAALFAASPLLALGVLAGWDLLGVAALAAAMAAWSAQRPRWAGVAIGAGAATSGYPALLLLALLVWCLRERRMRSWLRLLATSLVSAVLVGAPALLIDAGAWRLAGRWLGGAGVGPGSVWTVVEGAVGTDFAASTVTGWSLGLLALWCAGVVALSIAAPATPEPAQLGFLVVVGALLVGGTFAPGYSLLLLPLAVLARPRWRDQIVWQGAEVFALAMGWWYLGDYLSPGGGGDPGFLWLAILLRVAAELFLVALVLRDVWWPEHDPVRDADGAAAPPPLRPAASGG